MKPSVQKVLTAAQNNVGPPTVVDRASRVGRQARLVQRYVAARQDGKHVSRGEARQIARQRSKTGGKHPFGQLTSTRNRNVCRIRSAFA